MKPKIECEQCGEWGEIGKPCPHCKPSSGRGGKRKGAGRPKQGDEIFFKRCTPEQKKMLEEYWGIIAKKVVIKSI